MHELQRHLEDRLGGDVADLAPLGSGAWSQAFGFVHAHRGLVARLGPHDGDFRRDERAAHFAGPDLPVPETVDISRFGEGWCAISTRAHGAFLEDVTVDEWKRLAPRVIAALDAIRSVDISMTTGFGGWDESGDASHASWRELCLSIGAETPDPRSRGRLDALRASVVGDGAFTTGLSLLDRIAVDPVERALIHGDLLNRNVTFDGDRLTGVFDWGCSMYGDPLYEIAWFEFWQPWHQGIDAEQLVASARNRERFGGFADAAFDRRLRTCLVVIGLDHLAYNAWTGSDENLVATEGRLAEFM